MLFNKESLVTLGRIDKETARKVEKLVRFVHNMKMWKKYCTKWQVVCIDLAKNSVEKSMANVFI